jgi:hypothetical protein
MKERQVMYGEMIKNLAGKPEAMRQIEMGG